ncbi:hypothetical protein SAMN05444007_108254 [Cribrihabitans marinus]|uniref:Uncharacterized protein n=1 Tax=Cribrihabitans marinus TaxID=1227549 RepID=A0A1H7CR56_9RHOB|nr:hypothetical protein [Cribrihabitans marinus]GGH36366.1 hypothetical protein GCM10010973_30250 [Cribrihabitans marinus]SEJ91694.1 hypothetical protein SAMN05444007_108254 [Cribrihabitans marinus]
MCIPAVTPLLTAIGAGGAATATGAAAGAATIGSTLQTIGTVAGLVGTVAQGVSSYNAAKDQIAQIETQKQTEMQLNSVEEQRARQQFRSGIAQQRADLVARGVSLDSPTAVFLGQTAAREMTFEAQAIRQGGLATQTELTGQQRALRARGKNALVKGGISAAGGLLQAAPDLWPELLK